MDINTFLKELVLKNNIDVSRETKIEILDFMLNMHKIEINPGVWVYQRDVDEIIFRFTQTGQKIKAIKEIMELTGRVGKRLGLKEGKGVVDKWQAKYNIVSSS